MAAVSTAIETDSRPPVVRATISRQTSPQARPRPVQQGARRVTVAGAMDSSDVALAGPAGGSQTRIEVGQLLRVPYTRDVDEGNLLVDLRTLTRGPYSTALSTQPGIVALGGRVRGPDGRTRVP